MSKHQSHLSSPSGGVGGDHKNGSIMSITAPAGFVQAEDDLVPTEKAGYWEGPRMSGDGWSIETTWTPNDGIKVDVLSADGMGVAELRLDQVAALGTALTQIANEYKQ